MVDEDRLSLGDAIRLLDERKRQAENEKRVATGNLERIVNVLHSGDAPAEQWAVQMFRDVDSRFWPIDAPALEPETLSNCAGILLAGKP
jgi:hypothetical protein